jgi:hypothetical protein
MRLAAVNFIDSDAATQQTNCCGWGVVTDMIYRG